MPRPILATLHPTAIAHNIHVARQHAPQSKVWAVVKANAYGHGIESIYSGLLHADGLAMLDLDEAQRVRQLGWDKPILLLEGCFCAADYIQAFALNLSVVVHQAEQIQWLRQMQGFCTKPISIYLKLNTGMNRVGLDAPDYAAAYEQLRALPCVGEITLMTHFANADLDNGTTAALAHFNDAVAHIPNTMNIPRCTANSAAVLAQSNTHFDWVRPGIMLYGASPFADKTAATYDLQPAMTLSSELIAVRTINQGASIGYCSRFIAPTPMRIGIVACGYADGYPRHAPDGTPVLVNNMRTQLIGRVSMDMLMVDLSHIPHAQVGSPVELWGQNISIDEVAQAAGTIGYELMCALSPRVPRKVA